MRKEKGFTMVEVLATITIISILFVIVIVSINNLIEKSQEKYYNTERNMLLLAGKEYFTDYRSKLPKEINGREKVTLETLIKEKYIDPITDHKNEQCSIKDSYVEARKINEEEYKYYANLKCNAYKGTRIVFSPNEALTNKNKIDVEMTIESRTSKFKYSYTIEKNGKVTKSIKEMDYNGPVNITLEGEGKYIITGYMVDSKGVRVSQDSGEYIIDKTPPDCSKIEINSDIPKEKWQTKNVNLTINPHKDVSKWDFSSNIDNGSYKSLSTNNRGSKIEVFNKNGINKGKIRAYDKAGNYCEIETAGYYIDNEGPDIKKFTVDKYSTNPTITLDITDRNPPIEVYLSNKGYKEEGSFVPYKSKMNFNVGGSLDGKERVIYLVAKDALGNESKKKLTYNIYKECMTGNMSATAVAVPGATCSKVCGGGKMPAEVIYTDSYTGKICKTEPNKEVSCAPQDCCSLTREVTIPSSCSSCSAKCGYGTKTCTVQNISEFDNRICSINTNKKESCYEKPCTAPTCSLTVSGSLGTANWYNGSKTLMVNLTYNTNGGSRIKEYRLGTSSNPYANPQTTTYTQSQDTQGTTVYGYVVNEDGISNNSPCSVTLKKDSTPPVCTSTTSISSWTNSSRKLSGSCKDSNGSVKSGVVNESISGYVPNNNGSIYQSRISADSKYWDTCIDKASNVGICPTINPKIDIWPPDITCSPNKNKFDCKVADQDGMTLSGLKSVTYDGKRVSFYERMTITIEAGKKLTACDNALNNCRTTICKKGDKECTHDPPKEWNRADKISDINLNPTFYQK